MKKYIYNVNIVYVKYVLVKKNLEKDNFICCIIEKKADLSKDMP